MNRLVLNEQTLSKDDHLIIDAPNILTHAYEILKIKSGDSLKLCLLNKGLASAKVISAESDQFTLKIEDRSSGTEPFVDLMVGLCRPPSIKKILEHGTSLGVSSFHFFKGDLSEKSYLTSSIFDETSKYLVLGLAQSAHYFRLPKVHADLEFPSVDHQQKFFLTFNSDQYLDDLTLDFDSTPLFALGPERGWTEREEKFLIEQGYQPLRISESVLRVEIASFALLGQLHLIKNRLSSKA